MNFYEYQNEAHTLWEEDLENNVSEHNIGSSSPEMSEREEDDDHHLAKRPKFMSNPVEDLIANPQRIHFTADQIPFKSDDSSSQLPVPDPPKRKRGRPPGKKKQIKDTPVAFGDLQAYDPLSRNALSMDPSQAILSGMEPPIPVKRGRGRPRKYPLPNATVPAVNISMPKSLMPSDFEICNFVKEVIATSRTTELNPNDHKETNDQIGFFNDLTSDINSLIPSGEKSPYEISNEAVASETDLSSVPSSPGSSPVIGSSKSGKENGSLTPDAVMKKLEGHYGVNLSSRKHFLYEVFNLLWS